MVEEEDKPKPEGEQPSAGEAKLEQLRDDLKQRRKELKDKSDEELLKEMRGMPAEFEGKSLDELLKEIETTAEKIIQLYKSEKSMEELQPELDERNKHFHWLQVELVKRHKKEGYYLKRARAFAAGKLVLVALQDRGVEDFEKLSKKWLEDWENIKSLREGAKDKGLSMGEYFQWHMLKNLEEMIFRNFSSSQIARSDAALDSVPAIRLQSEMADTMLEVRERLESSEQVHRETAKILEKVAENTNPAQQFILIVAASALVAISFGLLVDIIFLKWNDEIKEHWVAATLSVIVIGVFAILAIKKWVFGKN